MNEVRAIDLDGSFIGHGIEYLHPSGQTRTTGEITMILHKKNGRVHVRSGRDNVQIELHPLTRITNIITGGSDD